MLHFHGRMKNPCAQSVQDVIGLFHLLTMGHVIDVDRDLRAVTSCHFHVMLEAFCLPQLHPHPPHRQNLDLLAHLRQKSARLKKHPHFLDQTLSHSTGYKSQLSNWVLRNTRPSVVAEPQGHGRSAAVHLTVIWKPSTHCQLPPSVIFSIFIAQLIQVKLRFFEAWTSHTVSWRNCQQE